ncbi:MAG: tetratricopeptide repeat protein [Gammaproteobacteria bacterium]|nr:tetratricopeptide repeat protein [Gammaproteobacteria bacterium]
MHSGSRFALATAALVASGCAATGGTLPDRPAPGTPFHQIMAAIAADRGATATAVEEYLATAEAGNDAAASRRAAVYAFEHDYDAAALRAARRWAALEPAEPAAHRLVARLLVRRNDVSGAVDHAEAAIVGPAQRDEAATAALADALAGEQNQDAVARVLGRIGARAASVSPTLQLALGSAALQAGDDVLAEAAARTLLAASPDAELRTEAEVLVGRALAARGDTAAALDWLRSRRVAGSPLGLELEYVGLLAADDRVEDALIELATIGKRYPDEPRIRRLRALIGKDGPDRRDAFEDFRALIAVPEFADEAGFRLAEMSIREQQYEQAVQLLARIGDGPWLLPAQDGLARLAEAGGEGEAAERLWERVAERYPQRAFEAEAYRAALLDRLGRTDDALRLMTRNLLHRPDDVGTLLNRGALLDRIGRHDEAIADMTAAVRILPDSAVALNALGYTLSIRTSRQTEALGYIRRALERSPDSAAIMDSYGWVLFRLGRLPEARSFLQYAYSQLADPEIAAHLGEVMWRQGDRDAARTLWQDAREKHPQNEPLQETVKRLLD